MAGVGELSLSNAESVIRGTKRSDQAKAPRVEGAYGAPGFGPRAWCSVQRASALDFMLVMAKSANSSRSSPLPGFRQERRILPASADTGTLPMTTDR